MNSLSTIVHRKMATKMISNALTSISTTSAGIAVATAFVGMVMAYRNQKGSKAVIKERIVKTWDSRVVRDHGPLKNIWPSVLYSLEAPGCSSGPPVRNMNIYRVPDGSQRLVIYNGVSINDTTVKEIEKLGTPTVLVVPNSMHREDAAIWKQKYPNIVVVCPSIGKEAVMEVVNVNMTMEEWAATEEWSSYAKVKEIDGWCKYELVLEVQLEAAASKEGVMDGKIAMLICDFLFTLPHDPNYCYTDKLISWFFDSSIIVPTDPNIIAVPAISRIARIFAIKDWKKVEKWYRNYAKECGTKIAVILDGHGIPVVQVNPLEGCTKALEGVADQLMKPRW
jgi:hypothetical protein